MKNSIGLKYNTEILRDYVLLTAKYTQRSFCNIEEINSSSNNKYTAKYFRCPFNLAASQSIGGVAGWAQ